MVNNGELSLFWVKLKTYKSESNFRYNKYMKQNIDEQTHVPKTCVLNFFKLWKLSHFYISMWKQFFCNSNDENESNTDLSLGWPFLAPPRFMGGKWSFAWKIQATVWATIIPWWALLTIPLDMDPLVFFWWHFMGTIGTVPQRSCHLIEILGNNLSKN